MKRKGRAATARQREFLLAVQKLTEERGGHPPSATEIADYLKITRRGARPQLTALEAKGLLSDIPITVSSGKWRLTQEALAVLAEGDLDEPWPEGK